MKTDMLNNGIELKDSYITTHSYRHSIFDKEAETPHWRKLHTPYYSCGCCSSMFIFVLCVIDINWKKEY